MLATFGPFAVSAGGPQPGLAPAPVAALRVRPRPHRGLRVTVTLKAPATVVLTLERVRGGGARSPVGSVTVDGHAGANTLTVARWSGRVPPRGSYVLVARTRAGAHSSAPRSSSFSLR